MKGEMSKKTNLFLHKAGHDPRAAALVALHQVIFQGAGSQAALDKALSESELVPSDKRLCTELLYGTLRHYIRLEWYARRYLSKPEKLPGEMYLCLLLALHEMAFLRIPARAAVNWAVGHVRNRFGDGLSRVANGSLRAMGRNLKAFKDFEFYLKHTDDEKKALGLWYSMPDWIVGMWLEGYGREKTLRYLEASQRPALSGLRLNKLRPDWTQRREELLQMFDAGAGASALKPAKTPVGAGDARAADYDAGYDDEDFGQFTPVWEDRGVKLKSRPAPMAVSPECLAFRGSLPFEARDMIRRGAASRQSAASVQALSALNPQSWPGPIWDACAGRGGKTLYLLESGLPVTLATDPSARRLEGLREDMRRLGLEDDGRLEIRPVSALDIGGAPRPDARPDAGPDSGPDLGLAADGGSGQPGLFGTILIDAPCSGFGTLSRKPEIRLRRTMGDVADLVKIQSSLLDYAFSRAAPGGLIAYITCTLNPAENQDQVSGFTGRFAGTELVAAFQTPADSPLGEFFYAALIRCP